MATTSVEDAKYCPKCGVAGREMGTKVLPELRRGSKVILFQCENPRCRWYESQWPVQVNPDGTVPLRPSKGAEKQFPELSQGQLAMGRRVLEDAVNRDLRDELG